MTGNGYQELGKVLIPIHNEQQNCCALAVCGLTLYSPVTQFFLVVCHLDLINIWQYSPPKNH